MEVPARLPAWEVVSEIEGQELVERDPAGPAAGAACPRVSGRRALGTERRLTGVYPDRSYELPLDPLKWRNMSPAETDGGASSASARLVRTHSPATRVDSVVPA